MKKKVVVFTGAGISAESGIDTYRSDTGLWNNHNIMEVCHPSGWQNNPSKVLKFYNNCRDNVRKAEPNAAHIAIAQLEDKFDVVVITQNIDDLHERAGSTHVIHLHGEITKVRGEHSGKCTPSDIKYRSTKVGEKCSCGFQLRPHIVWFDERPLNVELSVGHFRSADKVLVIGTSLQVYPAAALPTLSLRSQENIFVVPERATPPEGFAFRRGKASKMVPPIVNLWLANNIWDRLRAKLYINHKVMLPAIILAISGLIYNVF